MARWHSFDKVDWCFRGPHFVGSGFLVGDKAYDNSPAHFLIWGFSGKFSSAQLQQMLWHTRDQFPQLELWCEYREELGTQINELAASGKILHQHLSLGKVQIISVQKPDFVGHSIHFFRERIWWRMAAYLRSFLT